MTISNDKVVAIHYTLTNDKGETLDSSDGKDPLLYIHGGKSIVQGLEETLEGKKQGDRFDVSIPPEKAYGAASDSNTQEIPLSQFPKDIEVKPGMTFNAESPDGVIQVVVSKVEGDNAYVDANHPLAGQTLHFKVEVMEVRDATKEELDHGHAHDPEGHQYTE